jgi:hypothetical protein
MANALKDIQRIMNPILERTSMAIPDKEDVAMVGPSKLETLRSIIDGWSHIINI